MNETPEQSYVIEGGIRSVSIENYLGFSPNPRELTEPHINQRSNPSLTSRPVQESKLKAVIKTR